MFKIKIVEPDGKTLHTKRVARIPTIGEALTIGEDRPLNIRYVVLNTYHEALSDLPNECVATVWCQ